MKEIQNNLEVGKYTYHDNDIVIYVEKAACGHYTMMCVGLIGVTGAHYNTVEELLKMPLDFNKFTYTKYGDDEIIGVTPLDTSEI